MITESSNLIFYVVDVFFYIKFFLNVNEMGKCGRTWHGKLIFY